MFLAYLRTTNPSVVLFFLHEQSLERLPGRAWRRPSAEAETRVIPAEHPWGPMFTPFYVQKCWWSILFFGLLLVFVMIFCTYWHMLTIWIENTEKWWSTSTRFFRGWWIHKKKILLPSSPFFGSADLGPSSLLCPGPNISSGSCLRFVPIGTTWLWLLSKRCPPKTLNKMNKHMLNHFDLCSVHLYTFVTWDVGVRFLHRSHSWTDALKLCQHQGHNEDYCYFGCPPLSGVCEETHSS